MTLQGSVAIKELNNVVAEYDVRKMDVLKVCEVGIFAVNLYGPHAVFLGCVMYTGSPTQFMSWKTNIGGGASRVVQNVHFDPQLKTIILNRIKGQGCHFPPVVDDIEIV